MSLAKSVYSLGALLKAEALLIGSYVLLALIWEGYRDTIAMIYAVLILLVPVLWGINKMAKTVGYKTMECEVCGNRETKKI